MRLLIVHRYYFPDTPTMAFLLKKMVSFFKNEMNTVSVLTAMPSYHGSENIKVSKNENYENVEIRRVSLLPEFGRKMSLRFLNSLLFGLKIFFHIIRHGRSKYDVVQVATTPPIISALAVALASELKGLKFVYHCQDIYPDITLIDKDDNKFNGYKKALWKIDKWIMLKASKIVVLSTDMKNHLHQSRSIDLKKIEIINNFEFNETKPSDSIPFIVEQILKEKKPILVFAGNIGVFQQLDKICEAVNLAQRKIKFTFLVIGEGIKRNEFEKKYGNENIIFTGFMPNKDIIKVYRNTHAGIAPVVKGIENVAFPSKIISYTMAGLPVLSFSSENSDIERIIMENKLGINYSYDGENSLVNKIIEIMSNKLDQDQIKNKAKSIFSERKTLNKWNKMHNTIIANG